MADERLKRHRDRLGRLALKGQAEAAEHIRICPRCERLFLVAYEASADRLGGLYPNLPRALAIPSTDVWLITKDLLREFRQCQGWPKGI
jgi:hypothetical protein